MAKKIVQLNSLVTQNSTDIYECSKNGTGSFKETRQQVLNYIHANEYKTFRTISASSSPSKVLDFNNVMYCTNAIPISITNFDNGGGTTQLGWNTTVIASNGQVTITNNGDVHVVMLVPTGQTNVLQQNDAAVILKIAEVGLDNYYLVYGVQSLAYINANAQLASTAQVTGLDTALLRNPAKVTCSLATVANLTATYSNGAAGVGATLTNSGAQAQFVADGITGSVGEYVLVKNQTTAFQNGLYQITVAGDISTNWVLTRPTFYDTPTKMALGSVIFVVQGSANAYSSWMQKSTVTTVGASSVLYNPTALKLFDTDNSNILSVALGSNLTTDRTLTITPGDASRTITLSGDTTLNGTNTGDQTITLTGDVTGSGTGSFATTVASVGGSSAANVNAATVLANAATDANTASTIVRRDASGNFTAGTVTVGQLIDSGLTINTVPYANGSKQLTSSAVTPTELGYVAGVTSAIQTQLNAKAAAAGNVTNTTIAAFIVNNSANLAGLTKGAETTVAFDTEVVDQGSYFASNTFTAPVTGLYLFTAIITAFNLNAATQLYCRIITSNRSNDLFRINPTACADGAGVVTMSGSVMLDMDASDTAYLVTSASGGISTYDLAGGGSQRCYFTGKLVC